MTAFCHSSAFFVLRKGSPVIVVRMQSPITKKQLTSPSYRQSNDNHLTTFVWVLFCVLVVVLLLTVSVNCWRKGERVGVLNSNSGGLMRAMDVTARHRCRFVSQKQPGLLPVRLQAK